MPKKTCSRCHREMDTNDFYKNRTCRDGLLGHCKQCFKKWRSEHYRANRDAICKRQIEYNARHAQKMGKIELSPERLAKYREYRKANKHKKDAHQLLREALSLGQIEKPEVCENCLSKCDADAHHGDYSKPHDVMWLCRGCHTRLHRNTGGYEEKTVLQI